MTNIPKSRRRKSPLVLKKGESAKVRDSVAIKVQPVSQHATNLSIEVHDDVKQDKPGTGKLQIITYDSIKQTKP